MKLLKIFFTLALLFLLHDVNGQPFTLNPRIKPAELRLADYKPAGEKKANGRLGQRVITQTKDTAYYYVKGLSMYSPTYISINGTAESTDLDVRLCQENWNVFHKKGTVNGKQVWSENFKTEGDFGIMVIANQTPARYVLLAWTGKELKMDLPSVFTGPETANAKSKGWLSRNLLLVGVIAVALVIITILFLKLKNKKP